MSVPAERDGQPADRKLAMERLANEAEMRGGLERPEFVVMYQPVVDLTDGTVVGVEALARWLHPRKGLLEPDAFIPLAEETGLIVQLGAAVLAMACTEVAGWKRDYPELASLSVAVNLSARQLGTPEFKSTVKDTLAESGLDPSCLCLEITESVLLDDAEASARALRELKSLGIRIAVDDFGTGYSSLTYLKRFPVDTLKIDKSFIAGLGDPEMQRGDRAIVAGIIDVAHAFGLTTVGEGVETPEQLRHVRALGCEHAQGFLWSSALPPELAVDWIRQAGTGSIQAQRHSDSNLERPRTVLLVEDNSSLRNVLRYLFQEHGFEVVAEASDGREAIALARHFRPDVVILDLAMPGVGGLEALPLILAVDPGSQVVVLSSLEAGDFADRAIAAGAGGYFSKDADPSLLLPYVNDLLDRPPSS